MISFRSTQPSPGDSTNVLLAKLLQVFGGNPESGDSDNTLLAHILTQANGGGAGSTIPGVKIYRALLNQTATAAPVPIVLENTIGDVEWARVNPGLYEIRKTGAFPIDKTFLYIDPIRDAETTDLAAISRDGADKVLITTGEEGNTFFDNVLNYTSVQIIVYP